MKLFTISLSLGLMLCASVPAVAQTLNVNCGAASYQFDASQVGVMEFADGNSLTIQGRTFNISDISSINTVEGVLADNTVSVVYSAAGASVNIAGNIARYIDVSLNGGDVSIAQSTDVGDDTCGEITYILAGESNSGSFTLSGEYKASIELHGLALTNPNGAAIDIQNGKRVALRVQEGTVNTLEDGAAGDQKAALYCKGHLEFKQKGTLNVKGNKAHAIAAKEYIEIKNTTINITGALKDGINCNQYFLIESGAVNISGTADDGIQVAFKDVADRETEDTGSFTNKGGVLNINVTAGAAKAVKVEGDFSMTKGSITAVVSGDGIWDSEKLKTKAASCIGVDGNFSMTGGSLDLTATSGGGKGISVDGDYNTTGGTIKIVTEGGVLAYVSGKVYQAYTGNIDNLNSDYKSSPKGVKVDGKIVIDGGIYDIWTKGKNGEGIESKTTLTINGGDIDIRAYDDGTNSSSHTYIYGGNITITTGAGDAIDANGAIYVYGGNLTIIGAARPEQGFDAGDGYQIYINGGNILAAAGGNSAPSNSSLSNQAYVILSQSVSAGQTVSISSGSTELYTFQIPAAYSSVTDVNAVRANAPGGGGGGWGWGGSGGNSLMISTPDLVSGQSYTVKVGTTSTSATARTTGGGSSI